MRYLHSRGSMSRAERAEFREKYTLTNWNNITNSKRTKTMRNRKLVGTVDFQEATTNEYGIPKDPEAAAKAVVDGTIKVTEDPDKVPAGVIVETYSISVKGKDDDKDTVYYQEKNQPFAWNKVDNLVALFASEGANLSDAQVELLGNALADAEGDAKAPIGKAVRSIIEVYNSNTRANAKGADYQRILNLKAPMTEETKGKRIESMVAMFASIHRCSLDTAREKMKAAGLI